MRALTVTLNRVKSCHVEESSSLKHFLKIPFFKSQIFNILFNHISPGFVNVTFLFFLISDRLNYINLN